MRVKKRRRWPWAVVAAALLLAVWIARDLTDGTARDIRSFDGHEVGRLETAMWKAYYGHQRLRLFVDLTSLIRQQYIPRFWRAALAGF